MILAADHCRIKEEMVMSGLLHSIEKFADQ
jgi:hypothetical protein